MRRKRSGLRRRSGLNSWRRRRRGVKELEEEEEEE